MDERLQVEHTLRTILLLWAWCEEQAQRQATYPKS